MRVHSTASCQMPSTFDLMDDFFVVSLCQGFNISSPEGALVRVLITTLPKNLRDADPTKHGEWAVVNCASMPEYKYYSSAMYDRITISCTICEVQTNFRLPVLWHSLVKVYMYFSLGEITNCYGVHVHTCICSLWMCLQHGIPKVLKTKCFCHFWQLMWSF